MHVKIHLIDHQTRRARRQLAAAQTVPPPTAQVARHSGISNGPARASGDRGRCDRVRYFINPAARSASSMIRPTPDGEGVEVGSIR